MTCLGNKVLAPSVAVVRASKLCRTSGPPPPPPVPDCWREQSCHKQKRRQPLRRTAVGGERREGEAGWATRSGVKSNDAGRSTRGPGTRAPAAPSPGDAAGKAGGGTPGRCRIPAVLTETALHPGSFLLNSAGCPGVRDQGLGELPHGQDPLPTPTTPPKDGDRPGYELGQFQLRESELSRCKGETHSNLIKSFREARCYPFPVCNSSSWLFSAVAKLNIPKIREGCVQQSHTQQLLKDATSLLPPLCCAATLGAAFLFEKVLFCTSGAAQCPTRKGICLWQV